MTFHLTVNGQLEKFDNLEGYYSRIAFLRGNGFKIEYADQSENDCMATN
ncbi:hypothetical protein P4V41_07355 [Fictibacillus nanhaiensis]|nr:hypothetical protein [Fictibacillus nanhaiensis]